MPQAIDLVVNNGAGTPVSKTFTLIAPAAGDNSVAAWALKEGAISTVFPTLTASAGKTPRGRNLKVKFRLPSSYTDTVTGLTVVNSACEMNVTYSVPSDFPEALKPDFVAFANNLLNTALLKSMIRDAVSAN